MMGRSPQYYIPGFVEIGLPVPEKKIFEGFLPYIWAWRPSWSSDQHHVNNFSYPSRYLKAFIQNLVPNGTMVSEKIWFDFLYVHDLGPRSRNDLDLQYSYTFMKSISHCIYQLSGHRLQKLQKNPFFFTFSYKKPKFPNLILP